MKRSQFNYCDVPSKNRKVAEKEFDEELQQTFGFFQPAQDYEWVTAMMCESTAEPQPPKPAETQPPQPAETQPPQPAETQPSQVAETQSAMEVSVLPPPAQIPDGYIHLGDDMLLGVTEFLGYLKVHLRQYVVKNNRYIPTRTGITFTPYHWQVLSESIATLNLESSFASLMIERKLFLSVTDTSVVFQHVFDNSKAGLQLSSAFLSITHKQFRELFNARECISQLIQKKLLGSLFLNAIQEVFIVVSSDDVQPDDDEIEIQQTLKNNLIQLLKKHICLKLDTLKLMCRGCSNDDSSEHTCFETRLTYMNRCIAAIDIPKLSQDFVFDNYRLYPYMSEHFIENLNALEIFETCKFHLSVNL